MNAAPRPGLWWAALALFMLLLFGLANQGLREISGRPTIWEEVELPRQASPRAWLRDALAAVRPKELPEWATDALAAADAITEPVGRARRSLQEQLDRYLARLRSAATPFLYNVRD